MSHSTRLNCNQLKTNDILWKHIFNSILDIEIIGIGSVFIEWS